MTHLPFVTIFSGRFLHSLRATFMQYGFTAVLGRQPGGRGGSPAAIPLPLPGFLPQSPTFRLPHPPMGDDVKLHIPTMLHKTQREEIHFMKS